MTSTKYQTEEDKYLQWYDNAKKNEGLIDVKFHIGEIIETDTEQFYREANHFNRQLDRADITPRIEVKF